MFDFDKFFMSPNVSEIFTSSSFIVSKLSLENIPVDVNPT